MEDVEERALTTFHSLSTFGDLNSIEPCIQFTVEKETKGKLAFLDVSAKRRQWIPYHLSVQKSHTHQPIPVFDSHHPVAHKTAVVRTLIMEALRENGYPSGFIHRHSDNRTLSRTEDDQRLPRTSLTLPYTVGCPRQ